MNIRSFVFWLLDRIHGSPVKKKYQEFKQMDQSGTVNQKDLEKLLEYAVEHVPAYKLMKRKRIQDFPVVSKANYKENFSLYQSDEYLQTDSLHKVGTSGSTGQPFTTYQDKGKVYAHQAGLLLLNDSIGWHLGERYLFLRVWGLRHKVSKLSVIKNNCVPFNVINFTDERKEELRKLIIRDKSLHLILGYASALGPFAEYLEKLDTMPEEYGIKLVIADSDSLSKEAKTRIEKVFGCPVLDRYANEENGILAITNPFDERMQVNAKEYYTEVLKLDSDSPAEIGEIGRIVITDIYNKAFPFIRYDTGDLGVAAEIKDGFCTILQSLNGRSAASLKSTSGSILTEIVVNAYFSCMNGLGRYQIVQTGEKEYVMKLENSDQSLDYNMTEQMKKCFGDDAVVTIKHVSQIEQGKNGKYKATVYDVEKN